MRRRWRQPSLKGDNFDSPSLGCKAIGSSRISRPLLAARITISDASSIPGACEAGQGSAAVVRAVVDHDHFAVKAVLVEDTLRGVHALGDALGLVQARNDDRDLDRLVGRLRTPLREDANRHTGHLKAKRPV